MLPLLVILFALLGLRPAWGAPAVGHAAWDVRDGLPLNGVSDVLLGPDGYLWVATFDGVVRFDGVRFSRVLPRDGPGWPSARVSSLRVAPDGAVWAQTGPGWLVRIDPRTDALQVFKGEQLKPAADGTVWTVSGGEVSHLGPDGLLPFDAPALRGRHVQDVEPDASGGVWCQTETALTRISADGAAWSLDVAALEIGTPKWLFQGGDGSVWVAGDQGLARLPERADDAPLLLRVGGRPWGAVAVAVSPDPDGALWVATEQDLFQWRDGQVLPLMAESPGRPPSPFRVVGPDGTTWVANRRTVLREGEVVFRVGPGDGITSIATDHEGALWVGTRRSGLHQIQSALFASIGLSDGLRSDNVYAIAEGRDGLWIAGSDTWLSRWSKGQMRGLGAAEGLPEDIAAILEDQQGVLWVGARDQGLLRSPGPAHARFAPVVEVGSGGVHALFQRGNGDLLVGLEGGLWRRRDDRWDRLDDVWGLPSAAVRAIAETRDGTLWLGTEGAGVIRMQGEVGARWSASEGAADMIRAILPVDGGAWVGTEDQGMLFFDARGPTGIRLGPAEGLPDKVVHALVPDGRGAIWGNSNKGLFRVDAAALHRFTLGGPSPAIDRYSQQDGLPDQEGNGGNHHAGLLLSDGMLAFANQRGVVLVDPTRLARPGPLAGLRIEALTAGDQRFPAADPVTLAPNQRTFELSYTALSFRSPARTRFQHRLLGLETDWVSAGDQRLARYTAVPQGSYTFELRATDGAGNASASIERLAIVVQPHLTETLTFRAALVLLGLVGIGAAWLVRDRALRRRAEELTALVAQQTAQLTADNAALQASRALVRVQAERLAEIDRLKTRYFSNLSHELRTPLTLVLGPLDDVLGGRNGSVPAASRRPLELARRSAQHLFGLVNQLLDVVKIDAGQLRLRLEVTDLGALVQAVTQDLGALAERRRQRFTVQVPSSPVPVALDRRESAKIITNLVTNAIKYTPVGGAISVRLSVGEGGARLEVQDTGPGIPVDQQKRIFERFYMADISGDVQPGTGLGLALARELTELHGWTLTVQSSPGQGSTFAVELPLSDAPVLPLEPTGPGMMEDLPLPEPAEPDDREDVTTVLVVDDNPDIRGWIRARLGERFRVIEAGDGQEGLARTRAERPDLVVTDLMMPVLDGIGFLRAVRADPELEGLPVVMLTARGSVEAQVEGLSRGADVYLTKPFSSEVLLAQVESLILQRQRLRARLAAQAHAAPADEALLSADARYLLKIKAAIRAGMAQPEFGIQELADAVAQDRSHLYRRVAALTGKTPSELLREARLDEAARLLRARAGNISEVGYAVGFNSMAHFSTAFRKHFGASPTAWLAEQGGDASA